MKYLIIFITILLTNSIVYAQKVDYMNKPPALKEKKEQVCLAIATIVGIAVIAHETQPKRKVDINIIRNNR